MRIVAKFGGTSLGNGKRVERAAESISNAVEAGHEVIVVASAMGSTTDDLLEDMSFEPSEQDRDQIVSMGERTSVRMLSAALKSRNIDSSILEPGMGDWPIVANEKGDLNDDITEERLENLKIEPGHVRVVTGFLAEEEDGTITTLGRGGSDTTAMILGKYLDADRVTIVTDVEGVLTGDPTSVEAAHNVGEISVDEIRDLSFKGAEVIAPSALSYKKENMDVEVVHYQKNDILSSGTSIEGEFSELIDAHETPLASLTVAGREMRQSEAILSSLSNALADQDIVIDAIASGIDSLTFFVPANQIESGRNALHDEVVEQEELSSVTVDEKIAAVRIVSKKLPDRPGLIKEFVDPLSEANINIVEMVTSATSITVLVDWENRERTREILEEQITVEE